MGRRYRVGYKFTRSKAGVCNGNFLGLGADACQTAVLVEHSAPFGLLITNGEFVAFPGPKPTMVEVAGKGTVGFSDCTFVQWDKTRTGEPALKIDGGTVLVRGCEFREDKPQIELGQRVRRAVITGNVFTGPTRITNHSQGNVQIANNADEP